METRGKFILMSIPEFHQFLVNTVISRRVSFLQNHHTWSPSYRNFNGANHFEKLTGMEQSHLERGFAEIAQHITTFPDGTLALCRNMEKIPAGIQGVNTGGICMEHLGNFDMGKDAMTQEQKHTIIKANALLCFKFGLTPSLRSIVYHHWFKLVSGVRDGGKADNEHKTCPGTNFFGGNKETDCTANFLPLVSAELATIGQTNNNLPQNVQTGIVNALVLNVRTGPGKQFAVVDKLKEDTVVTVLETNGEWDRIGQSKWVNADFIVLQ